jgi:hypothetical protein
LLVAATSILVRPQNSAAEERTRPGTATQVAGAGRWQSQRDAGGDRDWQIQIQRFDDDSIEGTLIVIGSPQLHKVRLEGRVDGEQVYGVLVGDTDRQVGTFTGAVFAYSGRTVSSMAHCNACFAPPSELAHFTHTPWRRPQMQSGRLRISDL